MLRPRLAKVSSLALALALGACGSWEPPAAPSHSLVLPYAGTPKPKPKPPAVVAPSLGYGTREAFGEKVDAFVASFGKTWGEAHAFHGYVLVAEKGALVYGKGFGFADRAKKTPALADTRFRIGSVTKPFTATLVLALEEKGKLGLADPVRKHLPDLPAAWDAVTLEHLLSHTSGIANYTDEKKLMDRRDKKHAPAEVLAPVRDKPLAFEPGSRFAYSNTNYFLLGLVVEKVTAGTFADALAKHVLAPAKLTKTSLVDDPAGADAAVGYSLDEAGRLVTARPIDMSVPFSAGALRSTADDLLRFDRALAGDALLGAASKAKLWAPRKDGYALGFTIGRVGELEVQSHGGGIDGFTSYFARVPAVDAVVIALSSSDGVPAVRVARPVLEALIKGDAPKPAEERAVGAATADEVKAFAGSYGLSDGSRAEVEKLMPPSAVATFETLVVRPPAKPSKDGAPLVLAPVGQDALALFPSGTGSWFGKVAGVVLTPEPPAKKGGVVTKVTLAQSGLTLVFERGKKPAKPAVVTKAPPAKTPPAKAPPAKAPPAKAPPAKAPPTKKK